jgi:hypothetical protein
VEGDERRGGAESSGTYYSGFMSNRGRIPGPPPALLRAPSPPAGSGRSRGGVGQGWRGCERRGSVGNGEILGVGGTGRSVRRSNYGVALVHV